MYTSLSTFWEVWILSWIFLDIGVSILAACPVFSLSHAFVKTASINNGRTHWAHVCQAGVARFQLQMLCFEDQMTRYSQCYLSCYSESLCPGNQTWTLNMSIQPKILMKGRGKDLFNVATKKFSIQKVYLLSPNMNFIFKWDVRGMHC